MVELNTYITADKANISIASASGPNQTLNAFKLTVTEKFQALKSCQVEITVRITAVLHGYEKLKDLKLDPLNPRSANIIMEQQEYDKDRHNVISMICAFYKASGESILLNIGTILKRRARSVATLIEHWRTMLRATRPLIEEEEEDDVLWTCTPIPKEMSDVIPVGALDITQTTVARAEPASEVTTTSGTPTTTLGAIAHQLRSRSVEVKNLFTPKAVKARSKTRPTPMNQGTAPILPIRSSTPTATADQIRKQNDRILEKGSGEKKGKGKKGKVKSPRKTIVEPEEKKTSSYTQS